MEESARYINHCAGRSSRSVIRPTTTSSNRQSYLDSTIISLPLPPIVNPSFDSCCASNTSIAGLQTTNKRFCNSLPRSRLKSNSRNQRMVDPPDLANCPSSFAPPNSNLRGDENDCKPTEHSLSCHSDSVNTDERLPVHLSTLGQTRLGHRLTRVSLFALLVCLLLFVSPGLANSGYNVDKWSSSSNDNVQRRNAFIHPASAFISDNDVVRRDTAPLLAHGSTLTKRDSGHGTLSNTIYSPRDVEKSSADQLPSLRLRKRESCSDDGPSKGQTIGYAVLVPILVLLSGVFAGLTLGYMSLDETQLHVLMTTGDAVQRERARKIIPIRKDGHLLLTTLLIANMITNETLPIIFDPLFQSHDPHFAQNSKIYSVVVSTVLIVIFSELIPQSTCSRYGLQIGAIMAVPTRIVILILWPVAFPVSRILHWVLGPHHGIVYRRAELKELVTMHAASGGRGGDLNKDTVMIVGGALDLQEKVVKQAMTPIDKVFMLPFSANLDYPTLEKVVRSGHSRIPIYIETEVSAAQTRSGTTTPKRKLNLLAPFSRKNSFQGANTAAEDDASCDTKEIKSASTLNEGKTPVKTVMRKKIIGTLLVKQCVLLDPEDAVPVSSMVINALPSVPGDEPLLNVLNVFQEGRSHMAIVGPRSRRASPSNGSTQDLGGKSHLHHSSQGAGGPLSSSAAPRVDGLGNIDEEKIIEGINDHASQSEHSDSTDSSQFSKHKAGSRRNRWRARFGLSNGEKDDAMEQTAASDATLNDQLGKSQAFGHGTDLKKVDSNVSTQHEDGDDQPIGIITLEDVLEELLCEEILDEYDDRGNEEPDFRSYLPPPSPEQPFVAQKDSQTQGDSDSIKAAKNAEFKLDDATDKLSSDYRKDSAAVVDASSQTVNATQSSLPQQQQQQQQKKTMLSMLGLGRNQAKGGSHRTESGESTPPLYAEPMVSNSLMRRNTEAIQTHTSSPVIDNGTSDSGYFAQPITALARPVRSSSVPPPAERQSDMAGQGGVSTGRTVDESMTPALATPQPNRPVVLRAQMPGGQAKTVIANENFLRGRTMPSTSVASTAQGSGNQQQKPVSTASLIGGVPLSPAASTSRSHTPVGGNRGNRFKSQAAQGMAGTNLNATALAKQQQQQRQDSSRTQPESGEDAAGIQDDEDKA